MNGFFDKFWCYKILPLVYDESLSYYEVLCKLIDYVNKLRTDDIALAGSINDLYQKLASLKDYVDNYFTSAEIEAAIINAITEMSEQGDFTQIIYNSFYYLVDDSNYSIHAQVLPTATRRFDTGLAQQGFTIASVDGTLVAMNCFSDLTETGEDNVIVFTNFTTGETIARYEIPCGHCNSATYLDGVFYVACGGSSGANRVIGVNINGGVVIDKVYETSPYAITVVGNEIWVMFSGPVIKKFTKDMTLISSHDFPYLSGYAYQSIFSDNNYLYVLMNNTPLSVASEKEGNYIAVYSHDLEPVKIIKVFFNGEIEDCVIYNDVCYAAVNSQNAGMIITLDLYQKTATNNLNNLDHIVLGSAIFQDIYVDETYAGFLMDGTQSHPVSSLYWWSLCMNNNTEYVNLHLLSDCDHELTLSPTTPVEIHVYGHDHYITRLRQTSGKDLTVSDLIITGVGYTYCVSFSGSVFRANDLQLGVNGSTNKPQYGMLLYGSYEITGLTNYLEYTGAFIFAAANGAISNITNTAADLHGLCLRGDLSTDGSFYDVYELIPANTYGNTIPTIAPASEVDLSKCFLPARFYAATGVTVTNAPEGTVTTGTICVMIDPFMPSKRMVTLCKSDGSTVQFVL